MDLSTTVNITLAVLSFLLAAISIVTVVITLRQNNKMIENSTRPYICIYFDYTQFGEPTGYFVVKNFGASAAYIDSLTYNDVIKRHPKSLADISTIFDGLSGRQQYRRAENAERQRGAAAFGHTDPRVAQKAEPLWI